MSAKPEPESGAEKGAKDPREVHFAPSDIKEGMDEDDPEGGGLPPHITETPVRHPQGRYQASSRDLGVS